ncbi:hypothetical protein QYE76_013438 [Lolium multiflorum]|uniref:Transposase (putative) gypsy type domain-containing protein n=1 Tax=Lolium multiflorum TaxID=4521 RepID=A0AAD8TYU8_LOLMU|nr:hypothetical protein QYE76_013438 [Lolium multiflorum]
MGLHGSGFLQRSVRIRLSDPGPDFILHDQQQLGRPMGHMPPSPSMGHPGLPDLGTVDAPPASSSSAVPEPAGKSPERHRSEPTTVVFFVFLTPTSHRTKTSPPATPTTAHSIAMSSMTPPPADEPINATPISSAPPPFIPFQLDPTKDSGKDVEGTSAIPEKTSEAEKKAEEMAAKKSKARQRDSESKDNEMVLTKALVERGFSFPPSDFFLEILKAYGLQPHNISPNSVLAISNHVTLCEGHLRLEALEENELGTLLRVPSTGNTDPDAASEAEAPETSRPAKRKKAAPSNPHAKRAREVPSTAATRRAEAEKKRLSLIDTSNKGQPDVQHFFKPSGSPQSFIASKPDPKDIINVDDLPEDSAHHGDSAKGTSSPVPPSAQPSSAFADEEEKEQKAKLLQVTNANRVHLQPTPSLQKLTLSQRHAEVSDMLNKVWGKPDEEVRELADLENNLKEFFAKHKEVRQTTRKLHEDLRVHVLEQITEIEGLRQNAENSQQAIRLLESRLQWYEIRFDELSAKVQVLEAENESLKEFVKNSASQENQARKELIEKHARDLAELNEKLEKSQGRVISVISKNRVLEAEAEAIDKLIFPSLGFEWSKESNLKRTEAYDEARISIDALFEACRGIAKTLSLKKAKTTPLTR